MSNNYLAPEQEERLRDNARSILGSDLGRRYMAVLGEKAKENPSLIQAGSAVLQAGENPLMCVVTDTARHVSQIAMYHPEQPRVIAETTVDVVDMSSSEAKCIEPFVDGDAGTVIALWSKQAAASMLL